MNRNSDLDLIAASLAGNRTAYGALVERYEQLVCAVTFAHTGNRALSEELGQDTFLTAWKGLSGLRDQRQFRAWICGIARNLSLMSLRNRKRDPLALAVSLESASEVATGNASPREAAIRQEEQALLWKAMEQIPENCRVPLILFYREGQSIQAVAEALGISPNAAKQRLFRGRQLLHDEIATFVEDAMQRSRPKASLAPAVLAALPASQWLALGGGFAALRQSAWAALSGSMAQGVGAVAGITLVVTASMLYVSGSDSAKTSAATSGDIQILATPAAPENLAYTPGAPTSAPLQPESPPDTPLEPALTRQAHIDLAKKALKEGWRAQPMEAASLIAIKGWTYLAMLGDPEGKSRLMDVVRSLEDHAQNANWHMIVYLHDQTANDYVKQIMNDPRRDLDIRVRATRSVLGGMYTTGAPVRVPEEIEAHFRQLVIQSDFNIMPLRELNGMATELSRPFLEELVAAGAFQGQVAVTPSLVERSRHFSRMKRLADRQQFVCVVQVALEGLARIGSPTSIDLVRKAAQEAHAPAIRLSAVQALSAMGDTDFAHDAMRDRAAHEPDIEYRLSYAHELGKTGDLAFVNVLHEATRHPLQRVRSKSYEYLCSLGDNSFVEPATRDFEANGEPAGHWKILHADQTRMGFALQGNSGFMSEVLQQYLCALVQSDRSPHGVFMGLNGILNGSNDQVRAVLPSAMTVLEAPLVTMPESDGPDRDTLVAYETQLCKWLVLLRAGDEEVRRKAIALVEDLYAKDKAGSQTVLFYARWARNADIAPFFARVILESPNANDRLSAATWLLANEAGVLPG